MSEGTLEELLAILERDLGAESARLVPADDAPPEDARALWCEVPGGRRLYARFAEPPADASALKRRLEMLAAAFADLFPGSTHARSSRPPPAHSLHEELAALAQRTRAVEAMIIDARSPVVWGSAGGEPDARARDGAADPPAATLADVRTPADVASFATKPMVTLHSVGPDDVVAAAEYGLPLAPRAGVDPRTVGVVPRAVCARRRVLPIARNGDRLVIAMADPRDADAVFDVVLTTGLDVEPVFAGDAMAAFFEHLGEGGDNRTYEDEMASIPPETRAAREGRAARARDTWSRTMLTRRAIAEVRALPEMVSLNKGGHVRQSVSEPRFGYVARSFSAIYVLILAFDGPFDELLAKRAVSHALPTIERLVAALPPLDPQPTAGVAALRAKRRR